MVTKDRDFLDSYLITGAPRRLLWVTVGNVSNNDLLALFESVLSDLETAFQTSDCIELTQRGLAIHR